MALNTTNTLIAVITSTDDATQNVPINFGTGNPAFDANTAQYSDPRLLVGGPNAISIGPNSPTMVYVKNVDPAATITVNWTPSGGVAATVCVLSPGDQIILWQKIGGAGAGISALVLTPSAAPCLVSLFFGS